MIELKPIRGIFEIRHLISMSKEFGFAICGGYARYCVSPNKIVSPAFDVDIFFPDDSFKNIETIQKRLELLGYKKTIETSQAFTYVPDKEKMSEVYASPKVQLIKPREEFRLVTKGSVETILENFDFSITRIVLIDETKAIADDDFLKDEIARRLNLKNIHCPISSTQRVIKYCKKGYFISHTEILKLFTDWSERNDEYKSKLADLIIQKDNLTERANNGDDTAKEELQQLYDTMNID